MSVIKASVVKNVLDIFMAFNELNHLAFPFLPRFKTVWVGFLTLHRNNYEAKTFDNSHIESWAPGSNRVVIVRLEILMETSLE